MRCPPRRAEPALTSAKSPDPAGPDPGNEEFWHEFLTKGDSRERDVRRVFKHIPSEPRCRMCAAPFAGFGAPVMRLIGKRPSDKNPTMCTSCFTFMASHHGGAEIECTLLFADIRGSTTLAEGMSSTEFRAIVARFYDTAAKVVFDHDGSVDKFVGDEVVATFFPFITGDRHAARGIDAARALLLATGHADPSGPWLPVGAGVHTGLAWVGAVGEGAYTELTVLGDAVNTTSRLASVADAGEVLVTTDAARAAGLPADLESHPLELKGKQLPTEVVSVRVGPAG
jgi:adenylate cyclase